MWIGILVAVVVGCLVMSVVDTAVFGNGLYSVAWISVPYILAVFLILCYSFLFVYNHGLWFSGSQESGSSEFITIITASTPFVYTDPSCKGLSLAIKPQILTLVGAGMAIIWSMAIVVFVSPAYAGIIVLVTIQVLYLWYLLDLKWSSNYRLMQACRTLQESSGGLAVTLIEQMEATSDTEGFEPAALTVLRSLRGGLWQVFQDSISEIVARLETQEEVSGNVSSRRNLANDWRKLLQYPLNSLRGEESFREKSSNIRNHVVSSLRYKVFRFISCGRYDAPTTPAPEEDELQKVIQGEEESTTANEEWIIAIAALERSLVNRGQLADTLIRTDWKRFLRWCIETSYVKLRDKACDETIATLQSLVSARAGTVTMTVNNDESGDAEAPGASASPLEVSTKAAERKDTLVSEIFSKYGNERGKVFFEELTMLHDAFRVWQKEHITEEKRRKQESDEAERRRGELGKWELLLGSYDGIISM